MDIGRGNFHHTHIDVPITHDVTVDDLNSSYLKTISNLLLDKVHKDCRASVVRSLRDHVVSTLVRGSDALCVDGTTKVCRVVLPIRPGRTTGVVWDMYNPPPDAEKGPPKKSRALAEWLDFCLFGGEGSVTSVSLPDAKSEADIARHSIELFVRNFFERKANEICSNIHPNDGSITLRSMGFDRVLDFVDADIVLVYAGHLVLEDLRPVENTMQFDTISRAQGMHIVTVKLIKVP